MPLGTKDLEIVEGDLVRLTSPDVYERYCIPKGSIARIAKVHRGQINKYELNGYPEILFDASDIEVIAYSRRRKPSDEVNTCCRLLFPF